MYYVLGVFIASCFCFLPKFTQLNIISRNKKQSIKHYSPSKFQLEKSRCQELFNLIYEVEKAIHAFSINENKQEKKSFQPVLESLNRLKKYNT